MTNKPGSAICSLAVFANKKISRPVAGYRYIANKEILVIF